MSRVLSVQPKLILISRPDRIGDLVLSTPAFQAVKEQYPSAKLVVLVQKGMEPLIQGLRFVDQVLTFDPVKDHAGVLGLLKLTRQIQDLNPDLFIALQSHPTIAAAAYMARVPVRLGPRSKPHSYLFYNWGVRQRRSEVKMHEAAYNLELLRPIGVSLDRRDHWKPQVKLNRSGQSFAFETLKKLGFDFQKPLIVVHPGMRGSALNWPREFYLQLIQKLSALNVFVVISVGPVDDDVRAYFPEALRGRKNVQFWDGGAEESLERLVGLLSHAELVVAPSTGPLHIAAALQRKVLAFYPKIRVQSVERWGPFGVASAKVRVLVPDGETLVERPESMRQISVESAFFAARELLGLGDLPKSSETKKTEELDRESRSV